MRRLMLVAALLGCPFVHVADSQQGDEQLIVKITSSDPDISLVFTAAYVFGQSNLEIIESTTPHMLQAESMFFNGIFQQQSEGAVLEVRVYKTGATEHEVAMGDGTVIVMQETGRQRMVTSW